MQNLHCFCINMTWNDHEVLKLYKRKSIKQMGKKHIQLFIVKNYPILNIFVWQKYANPCLQ